jgi:predicted alpha/beta superfamily hydrolase
MTDSYRAHELSEHLLRSDIVAQVYRIKVMQPMRRSENCERFPVVYATDGDDLFEALATIAKGMQLAGEAPRFILVGIGYEDARLAQVLRWRDFGTREIRANFLDSLREIAGSPFCADMPDFESVMQASDAAEFLRFIREELKPLVDSLYPTLPDECIYSGYSAGGTFGLYTLFTHPETFKRYILGSPGTSYDRRHFGIDLATAFLATHRTLRASVFMSVGELEEFAPGFEKLNLTTGFYQLAKFLKSRKIADLDLTTRIFPDETHATAWMPAFSHGIRALMPSGSPLPFHSGAQHRTEAVPAKVLPP